MKWNYNSEILESNGYEDCKLLKKYTHQFYEKATEEERLKIVEDVFNIYREKKYIPN